MLKGKREFSESFDRNRPTFGRVADLTERPFECDLKLRASYRAALAIPRTGSEIFSLRLRMEFERSTCHPAKIVPSSLLLPTGSSSLCRTGFLPFVCGSLHATLRRRLRPRLRRGFRRAGWPAPLSPPAAAAAPSLIAHPVRATCLDFTPSEFVRALFLRPPAAANPTLDFRRQTSDVRPQTPGSSINNHRSKFNNQPTSPFRFNYLAPSNPPIPH